MNALSKKQIAIIVLVLVLHALLFSAGWISSLVFEAMNREYSQFYLNSTTTTWAIALSFLSLVTVIEFSANFFNKTATWNTFLLALFALCYLLSSIDGNHYFTTNGTFERNYGPLAGLNAIFFALCIVFYIRFVLHDYLPDLQKNTLSIISYFSFMALAISSMILSTWRLEYISIWIMVVVSILVEGSLFFAAIRKRRFNAIFFLSSFIATVLNACEFALAIAKIGGPRFPLGMTSYGCILIGFLFILIYFVFVLITIRSASRSDLYKEEIEVLQSKILREQIDPHFFFNLLNHIKAIYRDNPEQGDRAIDLLAKHMRASVAARDIYLIPFSDELENISRYAELANLGYDDKFKVFYNIDCYDFEVPILALQPFIENAIRYSQVHTKEDGYIEVSSEEAEDSYVIKVIDNGVGFDVSAISPESQGVKNSATRFKILLKATTDIVSAPGEGTTITITIPKKG
ncbi:MAG: histidine kinase [Bacilli bacterium]|nr:histidine kinase [Bacilli bacterium]